MFSNDRSTGLSLIGGAPDDRPTRTDAVEHFLKQARDEVEANLREGNVADLEALYQRLDGDDAKSVWKSILCPDKMAVLILAHARAEELADEEPSY